MIAGKGWNWESTRKMAFPGDHELPFRISAIYNSGPRKGRASFRAMPISQWPECAGAE